jgi:hypothetical protein
MEQLSYTQNSSTNEPPNSHGLSLIHRVSDTPEGERIIGENLYARHSIVYDALPSYFLGFALIIGDTVQSWNTTLTRFDELGIRPVQTWTCHGLMPLL